MDVVSHRRRGVENGAGARVTATCLSDPVTSLNLVLAGDLQDRCGEPWSGVGAPWSGGPHVFS